MAKMPGQHAETDDFIRHVTRRVGWLASACQIASRPPAARLVTARLGVIGLLLCACASGSYTSVSRSAATSARSSQTGATDSTEIICVAEPMANYVIHLTSLAGLPWPTTYADLMRPTQSARNLSRLRQAAAALAWDRDYTGELTPYFVFLPAYLRLQNEFDLEQYFIGFENAIQRDEYAAFRGAHADGHDRLANWLFDLEVFFYERLDFYHNGFTFIRELGRLYVGAYRDYEDDLWPDIERDLEEVGDQIESLTWSSDVVITWEGLTKEQYDGRVFVVSLIAAPTSIPATGLSYGETLLAVEEDVEAMTRTVSFEFGRHLLVDVFNETVTEAAGTGGLDWTLFAAYQGLTEHYNRLIFPGYRSEIDNDVERFVAVFRQLHDQRPEATARQLMRQGLIAFRREHM
ncbi:MAG: hypothetical protein VX656_14360 [Candidatus Latescibacterota bacterium]|nr:hypothetical protein [Candidatus Latescibacterota bacterium]